ncbi:MAG: HAMP domain-containing protein [Lachnospiraceae bacterium]|nr:HAMP domain-containing protein [Lachnospiraceae bacterium]
MLVILGFTLFAFWFVNYEFLPAYYEHSKVSVLEDSYRQINEIIQEDDSFLEEGTPLSEESTQDVDIMAANHSFSIYIFELSNFFGNIMYSFDYPNRDMISDRQSKTVEEKTKEYVLGLEAGIGIGNRTDSKEKITESGQYSVYKVMDEKIGSDYLELFGQLQSGKFVYMRTNYQSMTENLRIFNHFLLIVAIGSVIISIFLMILVSNSFAKPILQIADIANKMANLDFDVRYPVQRYDEIGMLGNSINALSDKLENTISELKAANNELEKDIRNKIQIDEMRKEFLSNVSHELKTPIALIQGYAEGLQDNISDDVESREFYCDVIIDEANKMNKTVKKLLTLNQIEFGKNQIQFERFNIVQVLESVVQSATLLAEQKDAEIALENDEPIYVWADEYMVEEVITNYISNAINHVSGENEIRVYIERREHVVRISVFNTGVPIPEEDLDKIWIKFYKVDKARTREYGGSGIGLSIVKAIMSSMNQECGVKNHEDGVEFWFELDCQMID